VPALFPIVVIDLIGFGIVIPLLPFYAERFQAAPDVVALLMATYSFTQFLSTPIWGRASDLWGRRPILLLSLAGAVASYTWLAFADGLWMLFAARALGGIMAGNISAAFAYVADITTAKDRAKGMGLVGAAFGLGFVIGPALGGILAGPDPLTADYRTPSLAAAGLSLTALVLALIILKESLSPEIRARLAQQPVQPRLALFIEVLGRREVGLLIAITFLATFVFAGMEAVFALWSERTMGWGPEQNGYLFAFVGVLGALVQGGLMGRLARRFGEANLIVQGAVALALGLVALPFSDTLAFLLPAMLFLVYGFSICTPSLNSLISKRVGADEQGKVLGVTRSASTLARVAGPAWAGFLFTALGKSWPFFGGAVVMIGVLFLGLRVRRRRRANTS
jgi:DHA1 family tetracycline resistance protein-like MFS transporter